MRGMDRECSLTSQIHWGKVIKAFAKIPNDQNAKKNFTGVGLLLPFWLPRECYASVGKTHCCIDMCTAVNNTFCFVCQ